MGVILSFLSKFRKKKSAEDKLEDLTQKIKDIEEFQQCEQERLLLRVKQWVNSSSVLYLLMAFYIFLVMSTPKLGIHYFTLLVCPILIWLIRRLIIYYYKRKIVKSRTRIESYKTEKRKIIEDVMETETYKVAYRILEKYDNPSLSKKFTPNSSKVSTPIPIPKAPSTSSTPLNTELRKRGSRDAFFNNTTNQIVSKTPLIRPIISERGVFDKLLQRVVGDGPNERFALICRACGSHNGMALKEEFEYLSYRCAFCGYFNPSRKQRPVISNALAIEAPKDFSDSDSSINSRKSLKIKELEDSDSTDKLSSESTPETSSSSYDNDNVPKQSILKEENNNGKTESVIQDANKIKNEEEEEEKESSDVKGKSKSFKETLKEIDDAKVKVDIIPLKDFEDKENKIININKQTIEINKPLKFKSDNKLDSSILEDKEVVGDTPMDIDDENVNTSSNVKDNMLIDS